MRRARRAFTLVEILVSLAIAAVLVSLLVFAVNAVRAASRRAGCQNNLRQIALGLSNYEAAYKTYPRGCGDHGASPLVAILPYLERADLYHRINFSGDVDGNAFTIQTPVATFRCPATLEQARVRTDFVLNRGTTLAVKRNSPWFFEERTFPTPSDFQDGLSNTALMCETCPRVEGQKKGALMRLERRSILTEIESSLFTHECIAAANHDELSRIDNGKFWFGAGTMNYFHILPPNAASCGNGNQWQQSLFTANSMHPGGVNTLFADTHVDFVVNTIDTKVWVQLGDR